MLQRVSLNGSSFSDVGDLELHEEVALLVYGEVTAVGRTSNQSMGDFETRTVSIQGLIRLDGVEGREAITRVMADLDKADAATVNGETGG